MEFRIGLALLVVPLLTVVSAADYPPKVGERHPEFSLPRIDNGQSVSLSDFAGKKVLLIHFASW